MHGSVLSVHSARVLPGGNIYLKHPKLANDVGILAISNFSPSVTLDLGSTVSSKPAYLEKPFNK